MLTRVSTPVTPKRKQVTPRRWKKRTPKRYRSCGNEARANHQTNPRALDLSCLDHEGRLVTNFSGSLKFTIYDDTDRDAVPQSQIVPADMKSSYLMEIARLACNFYPALKQHLINDSSGLLEWLELVPPYVVVDPTTGPVSILRLLVSESKMYRLQVLFPFIRNVCTGKKQTRGVNI